MNDALEAFSVALGTAIVFSVPFAFLTIWRFLRYRENVALAKEGLMPERQRRRRGNLLRWGMVIMVMGFGLFLGLWPLGPIIDPEMAARVPLGLGPWMLIGILPIFFGLSLIILHGINDHLESEEKTAVEEEDPIPPHKWG